MLSILIPVYAFDVQSIVNDLHQQASALDVAWEILLFDDHSPEEWQVKNRRLAQLEGVTYTELEENIGRAAIRNALATAAQYPYLLFLDCDSQTNSTAYLRNYIEHIAPNRVICGGRNYKEAPPSDHRYLLHWKYGKTREVRSAQERSQNAHHGFMTNNFLIPKAIFENTQLDSRIKTYGHEDTLLGLQLKEKNIDILHIDNPLLHIGLEPAQEWLHKQEQAIKNLYWLHQQHAELKTPALELWLLLRKWGLMLVIYPVLKLRADSIKRHLFTSKHPILRRFDLLKLLWLEGIKRS